MIDERERQLIAEAIAAVERRTNAELVTVLAARSDDYRPFAVLWAAVLALLPAPVLVFAAPTAAHLVVVELATFCVLVLLFLFTPLGMRLVPERLRRVRAGSLARSQFLERGLHHTREETGLLLFVSQAEHYVEILADRGIANHVQPDRWQSIVDTFVTDVRGERVLQGFLTAIESCGEILAEVCPKTPDNRNELDDRLILIGYDP
jgi:putative membrane protein